MLMSCKVVECRLRHMSMHAPESVVVSARVLMVGLTGRGGGRVGHEEQGQGLTQPRQCTPEGLHLRDHRQKGGLRKGCWTGEGLKAIAGLGGGVLGLWPMPTCSTCCSFWEGGPVVQSPDTTTNLHTTTSLSETRLVTTTRIITMLRQIGGKKRDMTTHQR